MEGRGRSANGPALDFDVFLVDYGLGYLFGCAARNTHGKAKGLVIDDKNDVDSHSTVPCYAIRNLSGVTNVLHSKLTSRDKRHYSNDCCQRKQNQQHFHAYTSTNIMPNRGPFVNIGVDITCHTMRT